MLLRSFRQSAVLPPSGPLLVFSHSSSSSAATAAIKRRSLATQHGVRAAAAVKVLSSSVMATSSGAVIDGSAPPVPVAKKVRHEMEMFGDVRIDNYYWLRDDSRSDPEVLSYLQQENAHTDYAMSGLL